MASRCAGSLRRIIPLSPLRSLGLRSRPASPSPSFSAGAAAPSPTRRFSSLSRIPVELGSCVESLLPLHSAVAAARLTSRLSTTTHGGRALSQEMGDSVRR
ncbi:protein NUCLEAR FUSION DEFECTIVE 6, mitochondrial-like [Zingiber officinale]|uniref:protein NUCLEAR FUSION DEFECTIVE 6, mitochondrial-like n=1 Tax=Zingiber officinale TaxID=94328 RepID=UPI001C4DA3DE|nr:protein NUCLEAR FUSION DEFECTIVE 6, mitochondrial-like [Zingiber officinale]